MPEEGGESAFVRATEIAEFARLDGELADRDAVALGGSTDNERVKLAWRRDHKDLHKPPLWRLADSKGAPVDGLGARSPEGVACRVAFIVDPDDVIQRVDANNLNDGRAPKDALRALANAAVLAPQTEWGALFACAIASPSAETGEAGVSAEAAQAARRRRRRRPAEPSPAGAAVGRA